MVFVDDVATAVLLAAERDAAVGEEFLVSGSAPVTWRDFTMPTKKWLGNERVVLLEDAPLRAEENRRLCPPNIDVTFSAI